MKNIYFIGIGGVGMSAVAGLAAAHGWQVEGSDVSEVYEPSLGMLRDHHINWHVGYDQAHIAGSFAGAGPDLVVCSAGIQQDNPEAAYAAQKGIRSVSFPDALNEITEGMRQIVISGTHGKSTTSGLVGHALKTLHDSSFMVGAVLNDYGSNFHAGRGSDIVIEGDEYFASTTDHRPKFLLYRPHVLLINNIEFDHPDAFADVDEVLQAFVTRIETMPEDGIIVYNADDELVRKAMTHATVRTIGFGFNSGEIRGSAPLLLESGLFEIGVEHADEVFSLQSNFPGVSYAYDFLAAASTVLAAYPETDREVLQEIFANYHGVKRRFEMICASPIIIDDYAHHPTAVRLTLEAARMKYPSRHIVCFFEPHTYSRTKETLSQLVDAFGAADEVFIAEVYPAREQRQASSISGAQVVAAIKDHERTGSAPEHAEHIHFVPTKQDALAAYVRIAQPEDVVIIMAVGSFNQLAYELRDALHTTADIV